MTDTHPEDLARRHAAVRAQTLALAAPLSEADCQVQSMADASPAKWHLAHVTWFFETFVLERFEPSFRAHHPAYRVLFNSYYNGVGEQHPRAQRGLVTRPTLAEVVAWRHEVDERVQQLLRGEVSAALAEIVELGLQHEQQHQELLLTDVLHLFSCNPLAPVYRPAPEPAPAGPPAGDPPAAHWVAFEGGLVGIGQAGTGFAFDNERPRHRAFLQPYALASRPVSQGDWADFIADGGCRDPRWWLAAGWDWVRAQRVEAPLYWRRDGNGWQSYGLHGLRPLERDAPVVHLSLYEADAYTRWRSAQDGVALRLPTEFEWEHAAATLPVEGHFADEGDHVQRVADAGDPGHRLQQMFGSVWEWTNSAYLPYPGFRAPAGAVGEYNGKFMVHQTVLRGGSCATPRGHVRASYRNFFPADARWQFMGLRLARDGG